LLKAVDMARTLTRRYVLALASLAILATIALVGAEVVISRQVGTAELVNVAGRQRMLSQRAVLYADRLTSAATPERDDSRGELVATLDELARTHAVLSSESSGSLSPALHRIYFEGVNAADSLLTKFVAAGRALAAKSAAAPVAPDDPDLKVLDRIGPSRLLAALDSAVSRYEADGEAAIDRVRLFEMAVWLAGLLVLLSAALFIFAPLVRRLKENLAQTNAATAALAESEERFALAAQGSSVGIRDHYNLQQDEEYWSPQLYRLLGYEPGMLTARSSTFDALVHPDDRRRVQEAIDAHLDAHAALNVECRLQHKSQCYRWFLLTGQAIWSAGGTPRRLITSLMDIDARKQAEQLKSEFISTVAHELRTPLTSITGALALMRSKAVGPLSEKADHLATIAQDNCDRLVRLINDLLDVEKLEAGKIVFDLQPEDLGALLSRAVEQNMLLAKEHGATIVEEPLDQAVTVDVDASRFDQIMANLLSNAAKYSPPGGTIRIASKIRPGWVRVSVSDQGPGVPAAFRSRIFQRFAQADPSTRRGKSTGLGLNITKAIVEAHGGTIGFDSEEGRGATFYFDLPLSHAGAVRPRGPDQSSAREPEPAIPIKRRA
jgi:PAS domain S-box-containing protein